MSKIIENLASEFPHLEPSLISDVWHASFGNIADVRNQLDVLAKGFMEEDATFEDSVPNFEDSISMFHSDTNFSLCQAHTDLHHLDRDPMPKVEDVAEAPSSEPQFTESCVCEGIDSSSSKDLEQKREQILQLMATFGALGQDVVAAVFDSCGNDIEDAVTALSAMTECLGIERYFVFGEASEPVAVVMTAVFITHASLASLIGSCGHITDFDGRTSEVVASPIIINSYPCVAEDLCCPFGELAYLKIVGWGRTNGNVCAVIQCDVLKFEEKPARIKLTLPSEHGSAHALVEGGGEAIEDYEEIKPFWITGRICAQLSNGLICEKWPPKGYVDPYFSDEEMDDNHQISDYSDASVVSASPVVYDVKVDLNSVQDEPRNRNGSDGLQPDSFQMNDVHKKYSEEFNAHERILARLEGSVLSSATNVTELEGKGSLLASAAKLPHRSGAQAAGADGTMSPGVGNAADVDAGDAAKIASNGRTTFGSSTAAPSTEAEYGDGPREGEDAPVQALSGQAMAPCPSPPEQAVSSDCPTESQPAHRRGVEEGTTCCAGPRSSEAEFLPPWLRDQGDEGRGDERTAGALEGLSEAPSPSNRLSSCMAPWLKEDWNLQRDGARDPPGPNTQLLASPPAVSQSSPACVPVTALVWAETIAHMNETEAPEMEAANHGLNKRPSLTVYKSIGEPDSPVCVPVSALVWGEALALSKLSPAPEEAELAPSSRPIKGAAESRSISIEACRLAAGCDLVMAASDLHAMVSAKQDYSLAANPTGQSLALSESPSEDRLSCRDVRLVCDGYEYTGEVRDGKPHGWGLQKFKGLDGEFSGLTYRGNFISGLPHCSRGVAVWSSGLEFSGEFRHGSPISGSIIEPDGAVHPAHFPHKGCKLLLTEISEMHILEAISLGKGAASAENEFRNSGGDSGDSTITKQAMCSPRLNDSPCPTQQCKTDYTQQYGFLRNLFPDCEEPVLSSILVDCEGDVGKAIEFLLPAEDVLPPQEKKKRGTRLTPAMFCKKSQAAEAKSRKRHSGWSADGALARRLNLTKGIEQLIHEFPGLKASDVEEALQICGGDINETRQQLLILEMSQQNMPSTTSDVRAKGSHRGADHTPSHSPLKAHTPFLRPKVPEATVPSKASVGTPAAMVKREEEQQVSGEARASAAAEAEAWKVSTSKRAREGRIRARCPAEQYEGMGGDELRRLAFQHSKMNVDLSRMAVAAFQAGDRIEAAGLSDKALRHQEQFQVLNELARARIIETFNPDMDGRLCIDLHQLLVSEALELLETKLRQWAAGAGGRRLLVDVVTGAGNHSREGRAVLRPRVKAWLEELGMRYYPINDGMLKVDVSTFPKA